MAPDQHVDQQPAPLARVPGALAAQKTSATRRALVQTGGWHEAVQVLREMAAICGTGARAWRSPTAVWRSFSAGRRSLTVALLLGAVGDGATTAYGIAVDGGQEANQHAAALMGMVGTNTWVLIATLLCVTPLAILAGATRLTRNSSLLSWVLLTLTTIFAATKLYTVTGNIHQILLP